MSIFTRLVSRVVTLRVVAIAVISLSVISLCAVIVSHHVETRFRVIYSLDRRHNDQEIVHLIDSAHMYVYFAIYYFTEGDIADALIRAAKRGVIVRGIIDRDASVGVGSAIFNRLAAAGIAVETQKHEDGIMHIKALVTDTAYASGSYNWTDAATEANDEILEIGTDPAVHDQYLMIIKKILHTNE